MDFAFHIIQATPRLMEAAHTINAVTDVEYIIVQISKWLQENAPNFSTDTQEWNVFVRGSLMDIMQQHLQSKQIDHRSLDIDVIWYLNDGLPTICAVFDNVNIEYEDGYQALLYKTNKLVLNTLNQNIRRH